MRTPFGYRRPNEGAALIIVLSLLVLITVAVLIELAVSNSQRSTSDNAASGTSAELLARTAGALVTGQLVQEIHDGTQTTANATPTSLTTYYGMVTNSGYITYQPPYTNSFSMRMAVSGVSATLIASTASLPLVKESARSTAFYSGTNYFATGVTWASPASSTNASANGRSVSALSWNRPLLLPLKTTGSTTDFTPTNTYIAPDWIYLTRSGPKALAVTDLPVASNSSSSNTNYVIGRFAFNVYDEGGLLDVAATGNSSSSDVSSVDKARKGSIALADLTQIPNGTGTSKLTQAQADALVAWRNASSYNQTGTSGYTYYLFNKAPATGFLQPVSGDESFVSRQDLIAFWLAKISPLGTTGVDALRFFTTFSRAANAPAWFPKENASDFQESPNNLGSVDPNTPNTSYAYRGNANAAASFNRNLLGVRVKTSFVRLDGTTAVVGEPLIKTKFDLNRLAWITYNGTPPTGVTAADIYNYFGLTWSAGTTDLTTSTNTGAWIYNHSASGGGTDILTLDQVASLSPAREPDFFELLKAGILRGSLGDYSGVVTNPSVFDKGGEIYRQTYPNASKPALSMGSITVRSDANSNLVNAMEKYQIIQIGANLISQYSSDNYPTAIQLNGSDTTGVPLNFCGIKNLPYFNTISQRFFRPPVPLIPPTAGTTAITPNTNQSYVHGWIVFSLWNPHMNAGTASGSGPTTLRVLVRHGIAVPKCVAIGGTGGQPGKLNVTSQGRDFSTSPAWIQFPLSDYSNGFADPTELTTANSPHAQVSDVLNAIPSTVDPTTDFNDLGLYVGYNQTFDAMLAPNAAAMSPAPATPLTWDSESFELLPALTPTSTTFTPFNLELQYQSPDGFWHTYQIMPGVVLAGFQHGTPYLEPKDPLWSVNPLLTHNESVNNAAYFGTIPIPRGGGDIEFGYLDPRTTRIPPSEAANPPYNVSGPGVSDDSPPLATRFYANPVKGSFLNLTPYPYNSPHFQTQSWDLWDDNFPVTAAGVFSSTGSYYTDRDYVRRVGDSAGYAWNSLYTVDTVNSKGLDPIMPLPPYSIGTGGQLYRPIMLSRPFHSVGEMGYAFRDLPWKTLDFFTNKSADAALLDLFCLGPGASPTPEAPTPAVVAGVVNINSAPKEVLTALLAGAGQTLDPTNSDNFTATISLADAQTIAQTYLTYIQNTGPFITLADLPRALPQITLYNGSNSPTKATANSAFPGLKTSRELPIRTLASTTSTRTWNVLIDVVAQSGRFTTTASSLDQFSDKGERRYWFHIAIDRFTGKIVDQKVEFVPQ